MNIAEFCEKNRAPIILLFGALALSAIVIIYKKNAYAFDERFFNELKKARENARKESNGISEIESKPGDGG